MDNKFKDPDPNQNMIDPKHAQKSTLYNVHTFPLLLHKKIWEKQEKYFIEKMLFFIVIFGAKLSHCFFYCIFCKKVS